VNENHGRNRVPEREAHVYWLDITYPDGSQNGSGYRPYHWDEIIESLPRRLRRKARKQGFRWPRERMFLSHSSAYQRAYWLEYLGARVDVHRSNPVTWPAWPEPEADPETDWVAEMTERLRAEIEQPPAPLAPQ
jgi:hypothetical protein